MTDDIAATTRTWLEKDGFQFPDQPQREGQTTIWRGEHRADPNHVLLVGKPDADDSVSLTTAVVLDDEDRNAIERLPMGARRALRLRLDTALAPLPVSIHVDAPGNVPASIVLSDTIFGDGFTRDRLMRSVRSIQSAAATAHLSLANAIARLDPLPMPQSPAMAGSWIPERDSPPPPVAPSAAAVRACPWCRAALAGQGRFCPSCGRQVAP